MDGSLLSVAWNDLLGALRPAEAVRSFPAKGAKLSPETQRAQALVLDVARALGRPLLHASSEHDLEQRIERALGEPTTVQGMGRVSDNGHLLPEAQGPDAPYTAMLGRDAMRLLGESSAADLAVAEATQAYRVRLPQLAPHLHVLTLQPLDLTDHPSIPAAVVELVFERFAGLLAPLAIVDALAARMSFQGQEWLPQSLAQMTLDGHVATLRLLAGLGIEVPRSFVPRRERLDIDALFHQTQQRRQALHAELAAAGLAQGSPPPLDAG